MKHKPDTVKAIRLIYASLESHLDAAKGILEKKKCCNEAVGDEKFHTKCVKEYGFILHVLTEQL